MAGGLSIGAFVRGGGYTDQQRYSCLLCGIPRDFEGHFRGFGVFLIGLITQILNLGDGKPKLEDLVCRLLLQAFLRLLSSDLVYLEVIIVVVKNSIADT